VFLLFSEGENQIRFLLAIFLSFIIVLVAYVLNWLTLDGAAASILFGIIALGLGGIFGASVVLGFFITSSLLSKDEIGTEGIPLNQFRRNGMQVWASGFWFAFWLIFWFSTNSTIFLVAAVTAMAFSTADTWGAEVGGKRVKGTTWLFGSFKKVNAGVDGGVSIVGTITTFAGALLIGAIYWFFYQQMPISHLIIIVSAGFIGSLVDSLIGTYLQGKVLHKRISAVFKRKSKLFDNNLTNWVSSGVSSILAIGLYLIIS